ncbi:hypothetical protein B6U83_03485 [Thermoplasmatales archaeon ex4484_36]|nr:MAG: hypothetical protein B6U83_03485 [Thermoplasmatales archaeon ex4484_36]
MVEVGPGEGSLTRWLVKRGVRLTAIEVDPRLAATIRERFAGKVEVKVADVLDMDFCEPPLNPPEGGCGEDPPRGGVEVLQQAGGPSQHEVRDRTPP